MERYLITIRRHVPSEPNAFVKCIHLAKEERATLWLLGTKGSRRPLSLEDLDRYSNDQLRTAVSKGMLYIEEESSWYFAPALDPDTNSPRLMEPYTEAFARVATTAQPPRPEQGQLKLKPDAELGEAVAALRDSAQRVADKGLGGQ